MDRKRKVAAYHSQDDAINGVAALRQAGYTDADIEVLAEKPDYYTKFTQQTNLQVNGPQNATGDIATAAMVGGALGGLFLYIMEVNVIGMHTFGLSALYPLLGVVMGILLGLFLGALIGWYIFLSRHTPENMYKKELRGRKLLFLIRPQTDALGRLDDILVQSHAERL